MLSEPLTAESLAATDAVVIVTDHEAVDYAFVAEHARLIVDTRGVYRNRSVAARVIGLSTPVRGAGSQEAGGGTPLRAAG
jgi:UDP-N-acetyl-D-glucosamine dehydrogenase